MVNKMRSAIGGLVTSALMATSALGVTNAPVITSIKTEVKPAFPTRQYVTLSATNLTQGVNYYVYESTNLTNDAAGWTPKLAKCYNSTTDLNNEVSTSFYYTSEDFKKKAFFKLGTK